MTTIPDNSAQRAKKVKSQPLPTDAMSGAVTIAPMQLPILRTKLFTATPEDDRFGMYSVSIVVVMAKMIIEPIP